MLTPSAQQRRRAAHDHQRHPRFLQDRSRAARAGSTSRSRCASASRPRSICSPPKAGEKGLELPLRDCRGRPGLVRGDATRLRQILVNLLSNAVKFTERGEVVLRARRGRAGPRPRAPGVCDHRHGHWHLGARTRPGCSSVFPGRRLDHPPLRRNRAGLAIARRLAEMMGGTMGVESEPGRGSTFRFSMVVETIPNSPGPIWARPGWPWPAAAC